MTYCNFTFYCNYSWKRNVKCFGHFNVKSQTLPRDRAAEGGSRLRGSYIKLLRQKRTRRRSTEPPGCTWGPSWWHGEAHRCPTCGPQTRSRTARNSKRRRRMALSLQSLPSLLHIGYTKSNTGCQHAYSRVRARKCLWSATPCFYSALDVVEKIPPSVNRTCLWGMG